MSIIEQMKGTFSNFFVVKEDSYPSSPLLVKSEDISNEEDLIKTDPKKPEEGTRSVPNDTRNPISK